MKRLVYSQIAGRREGDSDTIWKLDLRKLGALLVPIISLLAWIILNSVRAGQVPILHQRISKLEDKVDHQYEQVLFKMLDIKPEKKESDHGP